MQKTIMTEATTNQIWVHGDLRSRHLLALSFKVLAKAANLAAQTGDRVVFFLLAPEGGGLLADADDEACAIDDAMEEEAFAWGADEVYSFENPAFAQPAPHHFAAALAPIFKENGPRLVLFALTDFGRDLAARSAATARAGLMADCVELRADENGAIIGRCPAWGGQIMAEITYTDGNTIGFATVQPHGNGAQPDRPFKGRIKRMPLTDIAAEKGIRLISSRPAPSAADDLASARTVVVGGAGLGGMENFGQVRQLAAALAGQVGATRPPVLNHWVDEDRLIGQTGKTVRPDLLISIATSGAIQYTAGILSSGIIVAVNRDPAAPIFQLADIGIVADAATFLPLMISRIKQAVLRRLTDDICTESADLTRKRGFGSKIKTLREAHEWSSEQLAEATGQTPEFITGVESGEISPPVAFLMRLSAVCGVDPGTFLREEEKTHIRDQRTQAYVNRTRNYSYQTLTSGAEHDRLRAFMVTIEPHHDHKPVAYKHEGEEFIFVIEGDLRLTLGRQMHVLKKGESIHFHSNIPHKLKSLSAEVTRCLVILDTM